MDKIRKEIVKLIYDKKEVHIGSALSCADILVAIKNKMVPGDTFILSKAHGQRAADVIGMPGTIEGLVTYCNSVGNGIGIGLGIALAVPESMVYVVCGDAELDEGSNWEAIRYIKKYKVPNIQVHVDNNGFGAYGTTECLNFTEPFIHVWHTIKGNGIPELAGKLDSHYHHITKEECERWAK